MEMPMRKANSFSHIGQHAINVLARLEARKAAKEQFRARGVKFYKHTELLRQASEYLAAHPELYEVALARAWQMGMDRERINAVVFDDDRRAWRKPRLPVHESDHAKSTIEKTQEKSTTSGRLGMSALTNC
jgi:hypothetical protein